MANEGPAGLAGGGLPTRVGLVDRTWCLLLAHVRDELLHYLRAVWDYEKPFGTPNKRSQIR